MSTLDLLVIAPHPDDAELGMGGTIMRFLSEGLRVGVLDLTNGEPTPHGSPEIRAAETDRASRILAREPGAAESQTGSHTGSPSSIGRRDSSHTAAMAVRLLDRRDHPDHVAATELVEAARFWAKLTKSDIPVSHIIPSVSSTTIVFISGWPRSPRSSWTSAPTGTRNWQR